MQHPVYYISKMLHDVEARYMQVKKMVLALVMASCRLRPYFQAHPNGDHPSPNEGCPGITRHLGANDEVGNNLDRVRYTVQAQAAMKGQLLVDMLIDLLVALPSFGCEVQDTKAGWSLYVNGSLTEQDARVGIMLSVSHGIIEREQSGFCTQQ